MNDFEVGALKRDETGKGAMRRLRTTGRVPGVIYGTGGDPQNISLKSNELRKHLEHEAFFSHILTVSIGGEKVQAVLKDLQRHPASYEVTHVDFLRVSATEELTMRVPLHFVNEERAPAHKAGGVFSHMLNDVEISCLPGNLPEFIEVDLGGLEMGDSVHLSGLEMPAGVSLAVDVSDAAHDHTVATVHMPHALDSGEEDEDEQVSAEVPVVGDKDEDED
jgi:large subunit ribosomal protein L25